MHDIRSSCLDKSGVTIMDKYNSRKYRLAKCVILIATGMAVLPPLITVWFLPIPMMLLTGSEWVGLVGSTLLFYAGSNVIEGAVGKEKVVADKTNNSPSNEQ